MPAPRAHNKRDNFSINTYRQDELAFDGTLTTKEYDFDISVSSAISIFAKYSSSLDITLLDREASTHLGADVVIATAVGTDIQIHKPLLRQGSFNLLTLRIGLTGGGNLPGNFLDNLKLLVRKTDEFGSTTV